MNQVVITALIAEVKTLRYTPAGVPALNVILEHESQIEEAGQARQVKAQVKAVAFGALAERMRQQAVGSSWRFTGFLATPRVGKNVVLHIQDFQTD